MADHLSFTLGRAGYRIHKIVPYGPVHETLQYLIRHASARILLQVELPWNRQETPVKRQAHACLYPIERSCHCHCKVSSP